MKSFYSNGKLLLTAEYLVLDGAKALAVPTKFGQSLEISLLNEPVLQWESYTNTGELWAAESFKISELASDTKSFTNPIVQKLFEIIKAAHHLNPSVLEENGYKAVSKLSFPKDWGLGSSSTLINNIAQWFRIDPFILLKQTFGGSGYDIACAQNNTPITFQLPNNRIKTVHFNPPFIDQIFFVHLNRKQDSREAISQYRNTSEKKKNQAIEAVSQITDALITCTSVSEFEELLNLHETIISKRIKQQTIKQKLFPDYKKSIKSLGGWGGDFIMAVGNENDKEYFRSKNYHTILNYTSMVL